MFYRWICYDITPHAFVASGSIGIRRTVHSSHTCTQQSYRNNRTYCHSRRIASTRAEALAPQLGGFGSLGIGRIGSLPDSPCSPDSRIASLEDTRWWPYCSNNPLGNAAPLLS